MSKWACCFYAPASALTVAFNVCPSKIGEAIAGGGQVQVTFGFGVLEAKDKKFRFTFDASAFEKRKTFSPCDRATRCFSDVDGKQSGGNDKFNAGSDDDCDDAEVPNKEVERYGMLSPCRQVC